MFEQPSSHQATSLPHERQQQDSQKRANIFLLLLIATIDYMGIGLVYPLFSTLLFQIESPLLSASTSVETRGFLLGVLLAACPMVQFCTSPILGRLSDLFGRKQILVSAVLIGAVGYLIGAYSLAHSSLIGLIASRIVVGISCASSSVVNAAMADSSDASTKTRNFTWLSAAYGIGLTVGPLLGGFFTNPNQYLPLTNIPLLASLFPGEDPARAFCAAAIGLTLSAILIKSRYASPKAPVTGKKAGGNALSVLRSSGPNIWFLLASTFFFCFGWSLFWELISATWVAIEHASVELVANRYAYGALWYAILSVSVTIYIVKQLSVQRVFYLGSSLLTCSMLAMYVTTTPFYLYGLIPLQQLGISLLYPASISTLSSKAPATVQGTVLGFHASASSLGFALSPLSAGVILPLSMYSPIFFGAGAIFMSLLLFMAARSYEAAVAWGEYSAVSEVTSSNASL